ncbi:MULTISPECIES: hypothetical protein [Cobetia]|uniref:hypothetical protein n=1 Tax=Cobetia TaxID=204286 RepID=UPI001582CB67|nr:MULTISPECIES: hypothetical protein [Cobetia]MDI4659532.1 hypothetical protein [Cobetia sp. BMC6]NUJ56080.1 hypothetical protein [Cobetia marina]
MILNTFSIFCDDIRQEIGDKNTFVGSYSGELIAQRLPIVLPKLCVVVFCIYDTKQQDTDASITIEILLGNEKIASAEYPLKEVYSENSDNGSNVIQANFIFTPVEINKPNILRAIIREGDKVHENMGLIIRSTTPPADSE